MGKLLRLDEKFAEEKEEFLRNAGRLQDLFTFSHTGRWGDDELSLVGLDSASRQRMWTSLYYLFRENYESLTHNGDQLLSWDITAYDTVFSVIDALLRGSENISSYFSQGASDELSGRIIYEIGCGYLGPLSSVHFAQRGASIFAIDAIGYDLPDFALKSIKDRGGDFVKGRWENLAQIRHNNKLPQADLIYSYFMQPNPFFNQEKWDDPSVKELTPDEFAAAASSQIYQSLLPGGFYVEDNSDYYMHPELLKALGFSFYEFRTEAERLPTRIYQKPDCNMQLTCTGR